MKVDQVLNEYRRGGADKRMSLFLYHCELRDAFERIERDDPMDLQEVLVGGKEGKKKRRMSLMDASVSALCRRFKNQ
jgi:hypothetical protein